MTVVEVAFSCVFYAFNARYLEFVAGVIDSGHSRLMSLTFIRVKFNDLVALPCAVVHSIVHNVNEIQSDSGTKSRHS